MITPLVVACDKGKVAVVQYFAKMFVDYPDRRMLYRAINIGYPMDKISNGQNTAIHHAASVFNKEQVKDVIVALLSIGADTIYDDTRCGATTMMNIFHHNYINDFDTRDIQEEIHSSPIPTCAIFLGMKRNNHGDTPLHMACAIGNIQFLMSWYELTTLQPDPPGNIEYEYIYSSSAATKQHQQNLVAPAKNLLKRLQSTTYTQTPTQVQYILQLTNFAGDTCLTLACCDGRVDVVIFLLDVAQVQVSYDEVEKCRITMERIDIAFYRLQQQQQQQSLSNTNIDDDDNENDDNYYNNNGNGPMTASSKRYFLEQYASKRNSVNTALQLMEFKLQQQSEQTALRLIEEEEELLQLQQPSSSKKASKNSTKKKKKEQTQITTTNTPAVQKLSDHEKHEASKDITTTSSSTKKPVPKIFEETIKNENVMKVLRGIISHIDTSPDTKDDDNVPIIRDDDDDDNNDTDRNKRNRLAKGLQEWVLNHKNTATAKLLSDMLQTIQSDLSEQNIHLPLTWDDDNNNNGGLRSNSGGGGSSKKKKKKGKKKKQRQNQQLGSGDTVKTDNTDTKNGNSNKDDDDDDASESDEKDVDSNRPQQDLIQTKASDDTESHKDEEEEEDDDDDDLALSNIVIGKKSNSSSNVAPQSSSTGSRGKVDIPTKDPVRDTQSKSKLGDTFKVNSISKPTGTGQENKIKHNNTKGAGTKPITTKNGHSAKNLKQYPKELQTKVIVPSPHEHSSSIHQSVLSSNITKHEPSSALVQEQVRQSPTQQKAVLKHDLPTLPTERQSNETIESARSTNTSQSNGARNQYNIANQNIDQTQTDNVNQNALLPVEKNGTSTNGGTLHRDAGIGTLGPNAEEANFGTNLNFCPTLQLIPQEKPSVIPFDELPHAADTNYMIGNPVVSSIVSPTELSQQQNYWHQPIGSITTGSPWQQRTIIDTSLQSAIISGVQTSSISTGLITSTTNDDPVSYGLPVLSSLIQMIQEQPQQSSSMDYHEFHTLESNRSRYGIDSSTSISLQQRTWAAIAKEQVAIDSGMLGNGRPIGTLSSTSDESPQFGTNAITIPVPPPGFDHPTPSLVDVVAASTAMTTNPSLYGNEQETIMKALCLDVSMLLYPPHIMAKTLSPCQLDAVEQILMEQTNSIQQARYMQQQRLRMTNREC